MILFIIYLFNSNRNNYSKVNVIDKENRKEMEKLIVKCKVNRTVNEKVGLRLLMRL